MTKKPYIPQELPIQGLDHSKLTKAIGEAHAEISKYVGLLQVVANPDLLLSSFSANEAILSSRIEGTQTQLDEVLDQLDEEIVKEGYDRATEELKETLNYRHTLKLAAQADSPINLVLIRQCHKELLNSVRGREKKPGGFRDRKVWIGRVGGSIENARFIPPEPLLLQQALDNWQQYAQSDKDDILLQTAVLHAQFEIIHPFLDGNGRIGRLLIPLLLCKKNYMPYPAFYLSEYLERNRQEYYDSLLAITEDNAWTEWILFFMRAIKGQAIHNQQQVKKMLELYERLKATVQELTHSQYSIQLIDFIFLRPRFTIPQLCRHINVKNVTASSLVQILYKNNIIEMVIEGRGRKPSRWAFPDLLDIINERS